MARPRGHRLDKLDIRIIAELQIKPRIGYRELGTLVGLKYTPCRRRVQRLFDDGYITMSVAIRTQRFLPKSSFCVLVEMRDSSRRAIEYFSRRVLSIKEIDSCWELNGSWDFVLRLHVEEDTQFEQIRRTINDLTLDGLSIVLRTQSYQIAEMVKGLMPVGSLQIPYEELMEL